MLDPSKYHDDLRLLSMAVRKRWHIDDDFREVIVARLKSVIETGDDEIALKAITEARQLEAQNQKDEHKNLDDFSQLVLTLAAREGVDLAAIGLGDEAEGRAGGGDAGAVEAEEE